MIAPLERLATNPLIRPSQISFARASGSFNPGATVDRASGRVVLLVRVFEEDTRRSSIAIALSSAWRDDHGSRAARACALIPRGRKSHLQFGVNQ